MIQTTKSLVVLSLNIEDIQRLTGLAGADANILMKLLRQNHKIQLKDGDKNGRGHDIEDATQSSKIRTYKIPKLGENGKTGQDIVYERPSQKLKPNFRVHTPNHQYGPRHSMSTTPVSIPGEIFETMFAGEVRAERRYSDSPDKYARDKDYHGEQPIMEIVHTTAGRPDFGHKSFVSAVGESDAIHIRQIGNRVISAVASSGRRHGGDLVLRPMITDGFGAPVSPGEVIKRRSMTNIQDNVMGSIPDPDQSRGQPSAEGFIRRRSMSIQDNVMDSIPDPNKYV